MTRKFRTTKKRIKIFLFISLVSLFFFQGLFAQYIPISSTTITVGPVSYSSAVHELHKMGYKTAAEDKGNQMIQTDFKLCPSTRCHMSIKVLVKNDSAQITGRWWIETAPPVGGSTDNISVIGHVDGSMDILFEEMLKYAKALGGSSIRYSVTIQNR
jgi:hypothetical protein